MMRTKYVGVLTTVMEHQRASTGGIVAVQWAVVLYGGIPKKAPQVFWLRPIKYTREFLKVLLTLRGLWA